MRRFRMTPGGGSPTEPWFRIGTLDVTTTMAVVLLSVISIVIFAVEPVSKPINLGLALLPDEVKAGQVWRVLTWPLANVGLDLWTIVTIFFFWYFGTELETSKLNRASMLRMLVLMTLALGLLLVAMSLVLPMGGLAALQQLELMVLLVWIAEWPTRRFFFNIPAWAIGAILVGLQVLQMLGYRQWGLLLHLLIGIGLCALIAKREGLLADYAWIPNTKLRAHQAGAGRPAKPRKRQFDPHRPTVVQGGWSRPEPQESKEQARMNELLDRIHASGIESLSQAERTELMKLRDRLRGS